MNLRTKMQWNDYFKGYLPIFLLFVSRRQAKTKLNPKQSVTSLLFSNKIHTQNFCDSLSCQACDSGVFCHSMHSSLLLSVLSDEHFPSFSYFSFVGHPLSIFNIQVSSSLTLN